METTEEKKINFSDFKLSLIKDILEMNYSREEDIYDEKMNVKSWSYLFLNYYANISAEFAFDDLVIKDEQEKGVKGFIDLGIEGLKEEFFVEFIKFDDLVKKYYDKYRYCKFYLLDDGGNLNIGLSFSNSYKINIDIDNDQLFKLVNEEFIDYDFSYEKIEFNKTNGFKDQIKLNTPFNKDVTEMVQFESLIVINYNEKISYSFKIEKLKFSMLKFSSTYVDKYGNSDNADRISFSVRPVMKGLGDDQVYDFNAGDLKP